MAFISHLVYRSYNRVISVLCRVGRLDIACMLSPCYALIWRLYAVLWRVYGVLWRCISWAMRSWPTGWAYGIGVWLCVGYRRVWSVVCVCVRCVSVMV